MEDDDERIRLFPHMVHTRAYTKHTHEHKRDKKKKNIPTDTLYNVVSRQTRLFTNAQRNRYKYIYINKYIKILYMIIIIYINNIHMILRRIHSI